MSCVFASRFPLDGFDLEVEADEGEDQTLHVLDQVIKTPQSFFISGMVRWCVHVC